MRRGQNLRGQQISLYRDILRHFLERAGPEGPKAEAAVEDLHEVGDLAHRQHKVLRGEGGGGGKERSGRGRG